MLLRWLRYWLWRPFGLGCRRFPLWPFRADITEPVAGVTCLRIENPLTRFLSRFAGGYDYAVCYLIDGTLLIDTGFPWARRCLQKTLKTLGADRTISIVVNTHYHEDHTGNNDLLAELTDARIYAHRLAVPEIRFPSELPWYRDFLFGPPQTVEVEPIPPAIETEHFRLQVYETPGHCPGHICLFEPERRWLFSGDLYVAAHLDSQLRDADGPAWIASLEQMIALKPAYLFDAHGTILTDEAAVNELLFRKRDFLIEIRRRVLSAATQAQSLQQIVRHVFDRRTLVDHVSFSEGWLSLITGSDFSRGHLVRSFLKESFPSAGTATSVQDSKPSKFDSEVGM
jgi:glyoxylase-like metal-dependent hydrolase (beta-lactamase superfamily II)